MSDLLLCLRAMPSSFNDALRTMDDAAYHIEALERGVRKLQARIEALQRIEKLAAAFDKDTAR